MERHNHRLNNNSKHCKSKEINKYKKHNTNDDKLYKWNDKLHKLLMIINLMINNIND